MSVTLKSSNDQKLELYTVYQIALSRFQQLLSVTRVQCKSYNHKQCHGTNFNLQDGGSRVDENFLSIDETFDLLGRAGRVAASRGIDKTAGHDFRASLKIKL